LIFFYTPHTTLIECPAHEFKSKSSVIDQNDEDHWEDPWDADKRP